MKRRTRKKLRSVEDRFWTFHLANPNIFKLFIRFAREAKQVGHQQYSARAIFHRVRWETTVVTNNSGGFKINNDYSSRYARLAMSKHLDLSGFFIIRGLQTYSELEREAA